MTKRSRVILWLACTAPVVIIALLIGIYWASRYEPQFYREALVVEPAVQEKGSDEMLQNMAAFVSKVRKPGKWQARFTAGQINGWLAVDFVKNHPGTMPSYFSNPRVAIEPGRMVLACRYEKSTVASVLTLTVEPFVPEESVLALRIVKARAGMVPMPLEKVLDGISDAAVRSDWQLRWRQTGGDPVALLSTHSAKDNGDLVVKIESIRLDKGEIFISGTTEKKK